MAIHELPVIEYVNVDILAPVGGGFILGQSLLDVDSFGDGTEEFHWVPYVCYATSVSATRGGVRDGINNTISTGTLSISFYNSADPSDDANIHPNAGIRLRKVIDDTEPYDNDGSILFTGSIVDVDVTYESDKSGSDVKYHVNITAVDAVQALANTTRYGADDGVDGYEKFEERIERLAASATIDVDVPVESTTRNVYVYNESAPYLDNWVRWGGTPTGNTELYEGRVGYNDGTGIKQVLSYVTYANSLPNTILANSYGASRVVEGLTIGQTYRLYAKGKLNTTYQPSDPAERVRKYKIGVSEIGFGTLTNIDTVSAYVEFPYYEFTATQEHHAITYMLAEDSTRTTSLGGFEIRYDEYFWDIRLEEQGVPLPYRLQSVVYEGPLSNQFSIATDSVGAYWYVDATNTVQFRRELDVVGTVLTFSDDITTEGALHYIDIEKSYDTRNTANDIKLTNHGLQDDPDNPGNDIANDITYGFTDVTSIESWGAHSDAIETSIYDGGAYAGSIDMRGQEILDAYKEPRKTITSLTWNVFDDITKADVFEIYGRINVEHKGWIQQSRIVSIKHDITPTRWLITLELLIEPGTRWYLKE